MLREAGEMLDDVERLAEQMRRDTHEDGVVPSAITSGTEREEVYVAGIFADKRNRAGALSQAIKQLRIRLSDGATPEGEKGEARNL